MADLKSQRNHRQAHQANKRRHAVKPVKSRFRRFVFRTFWIGLIMCVVGAGVGWLFFIYAIRDPYTKRAAEFDLERINDLEKPSIIYDRNGLELGRIYVENRSYVPLSKISPNMINALIAQEDARFREHPGYDLYGMLRAGKELFHAGGAANQGASTITQQLARNAYNLKQRTQARGGSGYERKLLEIFLSMRITERYSKDQVLEFYLNRIYLGSGFYGIRAASLGYFGKEPIDLTTREAASIAALIKNPNGLSPLNNKAQNLKWRNHVLARMAKEQYITAEEARRLSEMPVDLNPNPLKRGVSHINNRIAKDIIEYLGEDRVNASGLKIYTTLDKNVQQAAIDSLDEQLKAIEKRQDYQHQKLSAYDPRSGAKPEYLEGSVLVIENSTGAVLAYVGGRDFGKRNYDNIQEGARPPGTAILPFLYASALDLGYTPSNKLLDDAMDNRTVGVGGMVGILGEWGVETIKNRYMGEITLRQALSQSKIAASLRLGLEITPRRFIETLTRFGIKKPVRESGTEANPLYRPRIYVGVEPVSLKEMTLAYSAIPNGGNRPNDIYYLDRIKDETGYPIWESPQALGNRKKTAATKDSTAFQIHSILQDSIKSGSAKRVEPLLPAKFEGGVKTGTNYNFADNMLFGYDSSVSCGIWIGFTDGNKAIYPYAFSSDTCGPILGKLFHATAKNFPSVAITPPASVESIEICLTSGKRATSACYDLDPNSTEQAPRYIRNTYMEYLKKGDLNLPFCNVHGDENADLTIFFTPNSNTRSRILPVIPILPLKPALIGDDPYQCEQANAVIPRNLDLIPGGQDTILNAEPINENDGKESLKLSIPLPASKAIRFTFPKNNSL